MLPKGPDRTDLAMVKIKGGGSNRIAVRKTFYEEKKELTEREREREKVSPENIL